MAAADRILSGKPLNKDLRIRAAEGLKLVVNPTNLALEAGYARTYLYKNRADLQRVWDMVEAHSNPRGPIPLRDETVQALREQNAKLRAERNLAIDAARRCMQETMRTRDNTSATKLRLRLEAEVRKLKARIGQLETENAALRDPSQRQKVVPFRS